MRPSPRIPVLVAAVLVAVGLAAAACSPSAPAATTAASAPGPSTVGTSPGGVGAAASTGPTPSASPSPKPIVAAQCDKVAKPFDAKNINLTGAWAGDDDGIYYLRQIGSVLWWNGMSERAGVPGRLGREWNNVARGEIKDLAVDVDWADVPRGGILGGGTMNLKIQDDGTGNVRIAKISETGSGFGNNLWTPCKPG